MRCVFFAVVAVHAVMGWNVVHANDSTSTVVTPWWAVGAYASGYTASKGESEWYDLSNSAPRGGMGLNIAVVGAEVESSALFGSIALQFGDIPSAGWDTDMPWLQEAWIGYHLSDRFDIAAGGFISPIGIETVNSFENYSGIMSISYFFDPACHSGVQLTWKADSMIALTGGVVSSFSSYQLSAGLPSLLIGIEYSPDEDMHMMQALLSKESSDTGQFYQLYASVSSTTHFEDAHVLAEMNFGYAVPTDGMSHKAMFNGMLAAYFDITTMWQTGLRLEGVYDPQGMFSDFRTTSPLPNSTLSAAGVTATLAYVPNDWSKFRLDARYIGCLDDKSVVEASPKARERTEIVLCADVLMPFLGR